MSYEKAKEAIEASLADAAGIEYIDLYDLGNPMQMWI